MTFGSSKAHPPGRTWQQLVFGATVCGCSLVEDPLPGGPGELDPNYGRLPSLESFEAGPVSAEVLESLRDAACINVVVEPNTPPPAFEFIIDVSGSMSLTPDEGLETKWSLTRDALRESVTKLPEDASLGVVYFPNQETHRNCLNEGKPCEPGTPLPIDACLNTDGALPIATWGSEGSSQREAFEDALDRANAAGATPTHDALLFGLDQLREEETDGQRLIVLLTDGQPTFLEGCRGSGHVSDPVDPTAIIETIEGAAEEGIATFVVGAPGSEQASGSGEDARRWLSDAAVAGMTADADCELAPSDFDYCHHDLSQEDDFGDSLDAALSTILAQSKSCEFELPDAPGEQPIDPDEVNVLLLYEDGDGLVVGQATDDCEDGYVLTETDDGTVGRLCPQSCQAYRESLSISIELILGCEAAPVIPPT